MTKTSTWTGDLAVVTTLATAPETSGGLLAAVTGSSLLGIRNGLYGLQVNALLRIRGARRLVAAQLTIDESTAVAVAQEDPAARRTGFWLTGIAIYLALSLFSYLLLHRWHDSARSRET